MTTSPHPHADRSARPALPVYRAEVVGSLLRPAELQEAVQRHAAGQLSAAALWEAQSAAVTDALRLQADCGLEVCTDGEMRRRHFADPLFSGLRCFGSAAGQAQPWRDESGAAHADGERRAVTSKLQFTATDEVASHRFAAATAPLPVKVTVPSPTYLLTRWVPEISSRAYPDPVSLFRDTAAILTRIVGDLVEAGCRYVQFDAPELTAVVDPEASAILRDQGISPQRLIDVACELINEITDATGPEVKYAVHLCRGNRRGLWRKSGSYDVLSTTFFTRLTGVDTFMLEFDDERSGTFRCLSELPEDKVAVLGLITTKHGALEAADDVITRLREAAEYVPLDRLAISTQCGFASTAEGNPITPEQQRRKLRLVADVARTVWPRGSA